MTVVSVAPPSTRSASSSPASSCRSAKSSPSFSPVVVRRTPSYGSDLDSLAEMCLGESVAGAYGSGSANGGYTEEQVQIKPHDGPSTNTRLAIQIIIAYFEQKPSCVDQLRSLVGEEVKASMAQPAVATAVVQQCVSYLERLRNSPVGKGIPLLPSKMRLTSVHAPWLEVITQWVQQWNATPQQGADGEMAGRRPRPRPAVGTPKRSSGGGGCFDCGSRVSPD